jgi:hypothetical protein
MKGLLIINKSFFNYRFTITMSNRSTIFNLSIIIITNILRIIYIITNIIIKNRFRFRFL